MQKMFTRAVLAVGLIFALPVTLALAMPASIDDKPPARASGAADFNTAKGAIAQENWPQAIALLKKVITADPKNPEAFNLLGYATRKSGDAQGSLQYYQTALTLDPKHLGANEYIGEAYLQLNDVAKAEEHLKRLDELCTFNCKEYMTLKAAIDSYKAGHKKSS